MALVLVVGGGARADAQIVRGVVHDRISGQPVSGAIVTSAPDGERRNASTLTNAEGVFRLEVHPGDALIVVRHIGYVLTTVAIPKSGSDGTIRVGLDPVPTLLASQRSVAANYNCPRDTLQPVALGVLQQVRASLLNLAVAPAVTHGEFMVLTVDQVFDATGSSVREQRARVDTETRATPFAAASDPSVLARRGYMIEGDSGRTFFAPDANTLLDSSFTSTHCFTVQSRDSSGGNAFGVAFAPTSDRDTLVDVRGAIWVDTIARSLRELDFRFTDLEPAAEHAGAGGSVHFTTMPNGQVVVDRWTLRTVRVDTEPNTDPFPRPRRRRNRADAFVRSVRQITGALLSASWPQELRWVPRPSGAMGRVVNPGGSQPLEGVRVRLAGTALQSVTKNDGTFSLPGLTPGAYQIELADSSIASMVPAASRNATIVWRGGSEPQDLSYDGDQRAITDACGRQTSDVNNGVVFGRVKNPRGQPLALSVSWRPADSADSTLSVRTGEAADSQVFALCGLPQGTPIWVEGRELGLRPAGTHVIIPASTRVVGASFTLGTARVLGLFDENSGAPIDSAEVIDLTTGNSALTTTTGTVSLGFVAHDSAVLRVRKLGYLSRVFVVAAGPSDTVPSTEVLSRVESLQAVVTRASRGGTEDRSMGGFDRRRRMGFGKFISPNDMTAEIPTRRLEDILSSHGIVMGAGRQSDFAGSCQPGVLIDGVVADKDLVTFSLTRTTASDWAGVEFYGGPSEVPVELNTTGIAGCGLLVLWSKR